jgi:subtilisin family serine protease
MRFLVLGLVSGALLSALAACQTCKAAPTSSGDLSGYVTVAQPIPGEYVVVLKDPPPNVVPPSVVAIAAALSAKYGGTPFFTYETALRGFASKMSADQARAMAADTEVKYVQENQVMTISESQTGATWGIDRLDQRDLPLNQTYNYATDGKGVHAYIIDTGIRTSHQELAGRADVGFDAVGDGQNGNDCNGHGTHVSGTVGGKTYGVAKSVLLHAVRVLNCQGSGSTAGVVAGVDWVTKNRSLPAVANMSLGGGIDNALDDAVRRSVAAGVVYALAAGNENQDACIHSPARTAEAITVGATSNSDERTSFSNFGKCVDIFAPGLNITSSWNTSDSDTKTISGTSMATPHVAGLAALFLAVNPNATPAAVASALVDNATPGKVFNPGACSTDKLAYSGFIGGSSMPKASLSRGIPVIARVAGPRCPAQPR